MRNKLSIILFGVSMFVMLSLVAPDQRDAFVPAEDGVISVLNELGYTAINHYPKLHIPGVSVKAGEELVKYGFTKKANGKTVRQQSKHFVCTSCHNVEREDPDLSIVDPRARLEYTNERGLPFVQGSTLYGAVNRETFYNDDYEKKYGDLVKDARYDIRGAIQLCAVECAQGRALKEWEMESILAYMWSLELKMEDLVLSQNEKEYIKNALDNVSDKDEAMGLIQSKYMTRSPAHFIDPPVDRKVGTYSLSSPESGKMIYENGCLHCHENQRYSYLHLDNSKVTFNYLKNKAPKYNRHSIYHVVRYGIESKSGKESYMPKYTVEKMDVQQLDDLRTYIEKMAE